MRGNMDFTTSQVLYKNERRARRMCEKKYKNTSSPERKCQTSIIIIIMVVGRAVVPGGTVNYSYEIIARHTRGEDRKIFVH